MFAALMRQNEFIIRSVSVRDVSANKHICDTCHSPVCVQTFWRGSCKNHRRLGSREEEGKRRYD